MASITLREFRKAWIYQVQIRRAGVPSYSISFYTREEAESWVSDNEFEYMLRPEKYQRITGEIRLKMSRDRALMRKMGLSKTSSSLGLHLD